jgi:hypothetical protein
MNTRTTRFPYLMPAGDGSGGAGGAPELVEVDLPGGVKIQMPKAEAEKVIAGRNALKAEARDAHEQLGRIKAEKDAAEAARVKAETQAQAAEAMKKGEVEKATELLTKTHRDRETKIAAQLRDKALKAAVASNADVIASAHDDIVDQLRQRSFYDFDADAVVVRDEAGQPIKDDAGRAKPVDAVLAEFLAKRPHYLRDRTNAGTGAAGERKGSEGKPTKTVAELAAMTPTDKAKFFEAGGVQVD